jgi:hypothetical protein
MTMNEMNLLPKYTVKQMDRPSSNKFYSAFLRGEISGNAALPAWVLLALVQESKPDVALQCFANFTEKTATRKGRAFEWALFQIGKELQLNHDSQVDMRRLLGKAQGKEAFDNLISNLRTLEQESGAFHALANAIVRELGWMQVSDSYRIKIGWIMKSVEKGRFISP